MGAKTGLLVYADTDVPGLLKQAGVADLERTPAMMRRLYPGWVIEAADGSSLGDGLYPRDGRAYAGSWPGVVLICDRRVMVDSRPSWWRRARDAGWCSTPCTASSTGWPSACGRTGGSSGH